MSLRERLEEAKRVGGTTFEEPLGSQGKESRGHYELGVRIHKKLIEKVDLAALESLAPERVRADIKIIVERLL